MRRKMFVGRGMSRRVPGLSGPYFAMLGGGRSPSSTQYNFWSSDTITNPSLAEMLPGSTVQHVKHDARCRVRVHGPGGLVEGPAGRGERREGKEKPP